MKRVRPSNPFLLAAVYLAISTAAQPSYKLFERAAACPASGFSQCTDAGLPSNFCCPQNSACIPLAHNTTVLCCPDGSDCATIVPVTCDITKQNVTLNPGTTLMTNALTSELAKCGEDCCPFGYNCDTNGNCIMSADQQDFIPPTPPAPSRSPSSTASSPAESSTNTQSASVVPVTDSNSTSPITTGSCDKFPAKAILAGFFPGLVAGALLMLAGVCLVGSRHQKSSRRHSGSSFGNISEPQPSSAEMRTDFLRKQLSTPSTGAPSTPSRRNTVTRMRSLFRKSTSTNGTASPRPPPPIPLNVQREAVQDGRPVTPHLQREPSYEDINIFADGDTASALRERERLGMRASHQTTFTDMMERSGLAGLQKGQPYVYKGTSPGYPSSPPRQDSPRRGKEV